MRKQALPAVITVLSAACIGYLAFYAGGVDRLRLYHAWGALAALGFVVYSWKGWRAAPMLEPAPLISWLALLAYVLAQVVPLPLAMMQVLSPARAEIGKHAAEVTWLQELIPLSISTADTVDYLVRLAGLFLVFLIARELTYQNSSANPARVVLPLALIAGMEAVIGLSQFIISRSAAPATGTYVNRNHLGGLLGMLLPLAIAQTVLWLSIGTGRPQQPGRDHQIVRVCFWGALSGILLAGLLCSISRMSLLACVASTILTLSIMLRPSLPKLLSIALCVVVVLAVLIPAVFVDRFGAITVGDGKDIGTRTDLWKDSLAVARAFPLFGSGAGTYATALLRHKTVAPSHDVNFAHNDYLQHLCELGIAGMLPLAVLAVFVVSRAIASALKSANPGQRALSAGCAGSMAAILIHSFADFNLYIPANAAVFCWIAGVAAALPHSDDEADPKRQRQPQGWVRLRTRTGQ